MYEKFTFTKLDARSRQLMVQEITAAGGNGQLYFSRRFNETGKKGWLGWLLAAAKEQDEHWLADQLDTARAMTSIEKRDMPKSGLTPVSVPDTAAETMADGQFNRFYMAAICCRALEDGVRTVRVYRAKYRGVPRLESQALVNTTRNADALLEELRSKELSLKCDLLKPNSGLSVDY
jgi:hypothetical protein